MKIKKSASAISRRMRIGIATITSTAMLGGVLVAVPAHPLIPAAAIASAQEAPAPIATATGEVLDLALLRGVVHPDSEEEFLSVLELIRADAQYPGNESNTANINLTLLEGINLQIGALTLPLLDLLNIEGGGLGALGASAAAPAGNTASAAAGVLNGDGSINLAAHGDGSDVDTVLDLTDILGNVGIDAITDGIIDELSLRVGAVSASAQRDGDEITSEYALSNVDLTLNSPLIGDLTQTLIGTDGLGTQVDNAVRTLAGEESLLSGLTGVLSGVFDLLRALSLGLVNVSGPTLELETNIQGVLEPLLGRTLESEAVSIDLATGQISVNLEALGGTSAVDPNTNLLNEKAVAQITTEVNTLLEQLLDNVRDAIEDGLLETSVTVHLGASLLLPLANITIDGTLNQLLEGDPSTLDIELIGVSSPTLESTLLGLLATIGTTLDNAIDGVVAPLLDTVLGGVLGTVVAPLVGGIGDTLSDPNILKITLNDQPNAQIVDSIVRDNIERPNSASGPIEKPDEEFTVSALRINVLNGLIDLPLARATVNADADWTLPTDADTYDVSYPAITDAKAGGDAKTSAPQFTLAADGSDVVLPEDVTFAFAGEVPTWAKIDSTTGVVTVDPDRDVAAIETTFDIVVTYADASTDDADVDVKVAAADALPTDADTYDVSYPAITDAKAGGDAKTSAPQFTLAADGSDVVLPEDVTFAFAGEVPTWAKIDSTTGVVTVDPDRDVAAIETTFDIVVTYADATTDTAAVSVTVTPADVDPAPSLTGDPKAVDPTDESQDTGLNIVDGDESDVVAKDEDGNYLPVDVDNDGNISVTPGDIDGPITVIVNENDPDNREEREVPVNRGEVPPVDDGSSTGSSDFLQQCLNSPAAGVAGLLIALGTVGAIAGPALEPLMKSIGAELDRQLRTLINATGGANQPEWVRNINRGLNDAANAVDHRMVSQALFATAALALISTPVLCGMDNSSSSSS